MQVSDIQEDNQKLAQQAQKILQQYFSFNSFDETWEEECQEDGGKCWTKTDGVSKKVSFIRPIGMAAGGGGMAAGGDGLATGGGSNAGGTSS